ncbi:MAG: hypothetical protein R2834_16720 [Rhodothermales bacterium]
MRLLLGLLLLVLAAPACKTTSSPNAEGSVQATMPFKGTIVYLDLEGGFYGIEAEDGERYFPINLALTYREDGLRVQFDMRLRTDVMTTVMWGTPIEIIEMGRL